jgi:hypothetical protein
VLEDELTRQYNDVLTAEHNQYNIYVSLLALLVKVQSEMKMIDHRGSFASDDEVGVAFKAIQVCIDNIVAAIKELEAEK